MSFHFCRMTSLFSCVLPRLVSWRFLLSARRHALRASFAPLHIPIDFHKKPRSWHSSRATMRSSQAVWHGRQWRAQTQRSLSHTSVVLGVQVRMHSGKDQ